MKNEKPIKQNVIKVGEKVIYCCINICFLFHESLLVEMRILSKKLFGGWGYWTVVTSPTFDNMQIYSNTTIPTRIASGIAIKCHKIEKKYPRSGIYCVFDVLLQQPITVKIVWRVNKTTGPIRPRSKLENTPSGHSKPNFRSCICDSL